MKIFFICVLAALLFSVGTCVGIFVEADRRATDFQTMTGISFKEFQQAKVTCEATTGEICRIYGGFAPESLFAE